MAHNNLITEDNNFLITESGSYLVSEDLILPTKTGKKLLYFPQHNHIQGMIRVQGSFRLPQDNEIPVIASVSEGVNTEIPYSGMISVSHNGSVIGSMLESIKTEINTIGLKRLNTLESVYISGEKDYTQTVRMLKELGYENL